jgi:hypothetical protein
MVFATQLLVAGVHPKVVSDALGHASTAFTMDVLLARAAVDGGAGRGRDASRARGDWQQ